MIYTHLTNEAMKLAYEAHHGQVDKGGIPYIFHPYHLAEQMHDEYTTCVALLHDVVEDTAVTLDKLREIFPKEVTDAVALMTHEEGEDYLVMLHALQETPSQKRLSWLTCVITQTPHVWKTLTRLRWLVYRKSIKRLLKFWKDKIFYGSRNCCRFHRQPGQCNRHFTP